MGEQTPATASSTLNLYRRLAFGRKHLFGHDDPDQAAEYFIINPTPHKHAGTWRPVFYRGDNPKHAGPDNPSTPVARAIRTGMWNSFQIQLGDGVSEVLANKSRVKKRKSHERTQKMRRFFCMAEKPPKKPLEDPQEVKGLVVVFKMTRPKFLGRRLKWALGGNDYQWKGTRRFRTGWLKNAKGLSHDLKLVDKNNNVIAIFEKDRWASYKRSEKLDRPPNKKRQLLGALRRFSAADGLSDADVLEHIRSHSASHDSPKLSKKLTRDLNFEGSHSGDIFNEAIAFTCWIAIESEHRLRYKIFDLIEEVAESFGG